MGILASKERIGWIPLAGCAWMALSDVDLELLSEVNRKFFWNNAHRLAGWMHNEIKDERIRRVLNNMESEEPVEADMVKIPYGEWHDYDLAKAVTYLTLATYVIKDAAIGAFLDRICRSMVTLNDLRHDRPDPRTCPRCTHGRIQVLNSKRVGACVVRYHGCRRCGFRPASNKTCEEVGQGGGKR